MGRAGIETAKDYAWERRIDALEEFLTEVARPRQVDLGAGNTPAAQRTAG